MTKKWNDPFHSIVHYIPSSIPFPLHSIIFKDADLRLWSFFERENKKLGF